MKFLKNILILVSILTSLSFGTSALATYTTYYCNSAASHSANGGCLCLKGGVPYANTLCVTCSDDKAGNATWTEGTNNTWTGVCQTGFFATSLITRGCSVLTDSYGAVTGSQLTTITTAQGCISNCKDDQAGNATWTATSDPKTWTGVCNSGYSYSKTLPSRTCSAVSTGLVGTLSALAKGVACTATKK